MWVFPQGVGTRWWRPLVESRRKVATYDPRLGGCPETAIQRPDGDCSTVKGRTPDSGGVITHHAYAAAAISTIATPLQTAPDNAAWLWRASMRPRAICQTGATARTAMMASPMAISIISTTSRPPLRRIGRAMAKSAMSITPNITKSRATSAERERSIVDAAWPPKKRTGMSTSVLTTMACQPAVHMSLQPRWTRTTVGSTTIASAPKIVSRPAATLPVQMDVADTGLAKKNERRFSVSSRPTVDTPRAMARLHE